MMLPNLSLRPERYSRLFCCLTSFIVLLLAVSGTQAFAKAAVAHSYRDSRSGMSVPSSITFSPAQGAPGALLTIKGTGLAGTLRVTIAELPALILSTSETTVVAMIMPSNVTGTVKVKTAAGSYRTAAATFTVTESQYPTGQQGPKLADVTKRPTSGYLGYPVTTSYNFGQGVAVALSGDGNVALVGSSHGHGVSEPRGTVTEYKRINGSWQYKGLIEYNGNSPMQFGTDIALSADGNTAVLTEGPNHYPSYYASKRTANGIWAERQALPTGPQATDLSNPIIPHFDISADGNTILIGGYYDLSVVTRRGDGWVLDTAFAGYGLGAAISADGNTIAAGVPNTPGKVTHPRPVGTMIITKTSTGWQLKKFLQHNTGGEKIRLNADGRVLLTSNRLYTCTGGVWTFRQELSQAGMPSMTADGKLLIYPSASGPVLYKRNRADNWEKQSNAMPQFKITTLAVSADGYTIIGGDPDDDSIVPAQTDPVTGYRRSLGVAYTFGAPSPSTTPLSHATGLTFSGTTDTSTTLSWVSGGGWQRTVFLKLGTAGAPAPANGSVYTANSSFAKGSMAGAGWYCVYNGTGSSVDIKGLTSGGTYTASVVEYNGYTDQKYLVTGVSAKVTTVIVPPNKPTQVGTNTPYVEVTTATVYMAGRSGTGTALFMRRLLPSEVWQGTPVGSGTMPQAGKAAYAADTRFGLGSQIGNTGWYCIYNGDISPNFPLTQVRVTGLKANAFYEITALPYNGTKETPVYITDPSLYSYCTYATNRYDTPTASATALTFSNTTLTSTTLSWVNGNGASRMVLLKVGSLGAPGPWDGAMYYANNPYQQGEPIQHANSDQNWYCVYNGKGNSVNITGLSPSTTYKVAVVDYNGDNTPNGLPVAYAKKFNLATVTTPLPPGAPLPPPTGYAIALTFDKTTATTTTLSWLSSNGSARAVFLHLGTTGAISIVQGQTYAANNRFKMGTQAGTNGWYCVYNGTGSSVDISGLSPSSTYRAVVLEYNGKPGAESYNLTRYNPANVTTTTVAAPLMALSANHKRMLVEQDLLTSNESGEPIVHQAVSPNADGLNDVLLIDGISAYPDNTVSVMNSNGDLIYNVSGYDNHTKAFDGHANNGTLQKAGTYFYSLEYNKGDKVLRKTGYLVLKF